jgi:hypothetical protein
MVAKEIRVQPIHTKVDARYMKYILRSGFQVVSKNNIICRDCNLSINWP